MPDNDLSRDFRSERLDQADERQNETYWATYERIEAALIAGAIAEGADDNYKPDGAEVDKLVKLALRRNDD